MATRSVLMHSNSGVVEYFSRGHGWSGKRTNGCLTRLGLF